MKKIIVLFISLVASLSVHAQTAPQITTGRPGQAIGPRVPGTGVFQVQSGLDLNQANSKLLDQEVRTLNNIVRLGLSESFEISTVFDYSQTTTKNKLANSSSETEGVSQWQLGFRYNIIPKSDGWIPGIGIQTRFRMKHVSDNYKPEQVAPVVLVATNHSIGRSLSLNLNGGVSYDGSTAIPRYIYIVSLGQSIGDSDFGVVYEFYGNEYNDQQSNYIGTGISYLVNKDLQFDIYVSTGNNNGNDEFYGTLGVSWRTWLFGQ